MDAFRPAGRNEGRASEEGGMKTERIVIPVRDGTRMGAFLVRPDGEGPFPAIIVLQEVFGVNHHIRSVTERFAREGYLAVAAEMYHRTAPGFEGSYTHMEPSMEQRKKMTREGIRADLEAVYHWLQNDAGTKSDHIGSVGYCMGGSLSFGINTLVPLQAAVSYYGAGIPASWLDDVDKLHAPMILYWGMLDKHIGIEEPRKIADRMHAAGKKFTSVDFSFADHGFNCDERASYNPEASRQAWALTLAFFKMHLA
jgi:carboxymethylenebutenolidase